MRPLAEIVVVSTINTAEKNLTAWGRNGEAHFGGTLSVCANVDGIAVSKAKVSQKNIEAPRRRFGASALQPSGTIEHASS